VKSTKPRFESAQLPRPTSAQKLAITVLAGGPGGEREVSLESGRAVTEALRSIGHEVHCEDVAPDNLQALARQVDCVFIALHGKFGEDGQIQQILERRGLCYVGSGSDACALAMDKARAKEKFSQLGIPTPRYALATPATLSEAIAAWSLPVVVKPVKEGSSLNCRIIRDFEQFRPAVDHVTSQYGDCLVEEYIPGKELTVGILGDRPLPPLEIRTKREFYDYTAKYVDDNTEYDFDIDLPGSLLEDVVDMSLRAHQALGCRDFSRVDWRVDHREMKPYLLEVNVIPGLTSHSLLPKAAARAGLSMPQMCQVVVDLALKRRFAK
jgi:D-alanine-D-alanine ligase